MWIVVIVRLECQVMAANHLTNLSARFKRIKKLLKSEVFDYFQCETQVIHDESIAIPIRNSRAKNTPRIGVHSDK